jgi:hypothetical protein
MRSWWQEFLIEAGGGLFGTLAAAAALALAGKAAGLFDEVRRFDPRRFTVSIGESLAVIAVVALLATIVLELVGFD